MRFADCFHKQDPSSHIAMGQDPAVPGGAFSRDKSRNEAPQDIIPKVKLQLVNVAPFPRSRWNIEQLRTESRSNVVNTELTREVTTMDIPNVSVTVQIYRATCLNTATRRVCPFKKKDSSNHTLRRLRNAAPSHMLGASGIFVEM